MVKKISVFPSSIVTATLYDPFTKKMIAHPYVVWRRQGFKSKLKNNVYAFRITSKTDREDWWKVPVEANEQTSLLEDSCICTDAIFLLDIANLTLIGQLDAETFIQVIEARKKVAYSEETEAIHTLKNLIKHEKGGVKVIKRNSGKQSGKQRLDKFC